MQFEQQVHVQVLIICCPRQTWVVLTFTNVYRTATILTASLLSHRRYKATIYKNQLTTQATKNTVTYIMPNVCVHVKV